VFLLLKLKETGITDASILGICIFYNLVFTSFSFPAGIIADKFGLKKIFISGLALFAAVYIGMSFILIFIYLRPCFSFTVFTRRQPKGYQKRGLAILRKEKIQQRLSGLMPGFKASVQCWQAQLQE
jgi:MFS family permease